MATKSVALNRSKENSVDLISQNSGVFVNLNANYYRSGKYNKVIFEVSDV